MAEPGIYNGPALVVVRGDTWDGMDSIQIVLNGGPPAATLVQARMQFRLEYTDSPAGYTLDSDNGTIVLSDPVNWIIAIPKIKLPLKPGSWKWDLETTDSTDVVKTYLAGTLTIFPDVTRKRTS